MADLNAIITSSGQTTNGSASFTITGFGGTQCWWDDYNASLYSPSNKYPKVHCLTPGDQLGLMVSAEAGLISGLAVVFALALIVRNLHRYLKSTSRSWGFIQEPADIYVLLLFFFEFFQALGGITNIEWVRTGIVHTGSYCTAQGVLQQMGEMGVAISTLVIALHTFRILWFGKTAYDQLIAYVVTSTAFLFDVLFVALGTGLNTDYMAPDPFWCWLGGKYLKQKIGGEYIWIWLALLASIILYPPLFFLVRGNISVDPNNWYRPSFHRSRDNNAVRGINAASLKGMLLYPVIYGITVLPLSIARWYTFTLTDPSQEWQTTRAVAGGTFFAEATFRLSGVCNVIIVLTTRRRLLFLRQSPNVQAPSSETLQDGQKSASEQGASVEMTDRPFVGRRGLSDGLGALEEPGWDLR
ncbi:hypothetical protein NEOLEDRAFT_1138387 [Neolentinus lepideus HHB14362 ss-1]|uniref:Uncharacterized protein n=1 Tax=Neolentinus lepideus HHB14362 ss-1 TaxID=1314782 RepID=A0A165QCJ9_9AGAM|nr:hypothetical protein NEOLEDRAFT_1138387 [Neolentinus lepideus HHB14362 ss-1]